MFRTLNIAVVCAIASFCLAGWSSTAQAQNCYSISAVALSGDMNSSGGTGNFGDEWGWTWVRGQTNHYGCVLQSFMGNYSANQSEGQLVGWITAGQDPDPPTSIDVRKKVFAQVWVEWQGGTVCDFNPTYACLQGGICAAFESDIFHGSTPTSGSIAASQTQEISEVRNEDASQIIDEGFTWRIIHHRNDGGTIQKRTSIQRDGPCCLDTSQQGCAECMSNEDSGWQSDSSPYGIEGELDLSAAHYDSSYTVQEEDTHLTAMIEARVLLQNIGYDWVHGDVTVRARAAAIETSSSSNCPTCP